METVYLVFRAAGARSFRQDRETCYMPAHAPSRQTGERRSGRISTRPFRRGRQAFVRRGAR